MLEPRRLATRAAAQRMAATTRTTVGDLIGYQTRDERHIGAATRIEVVTEGVLTRRLQNDPELPGVGIVIFDEVHERNLTTDLGLALALEVASTIRPDLRILAMSATPDVDGLTRLLDAPVIESHGRMFDVEMHWVPAPSAARSAAVERVGPWRNAPPSNQRSSPQCCERYGRRRATSWSSSRASARSGGPRRSWPTSSVRTSTCTPLAGALSLAEQDRALAPSPPGRRRVVLSTDIAETSLTVDGVRVVVDSGLAREPRFDARTGLTRLTTVTTSRASAEQRAGRAGRTEPGAAYRLWSKIEHGSRPAHRSPEIIQADLASLALELAAWGGGDDLGFIDAPPPGALAQARALLRDLYALDDDDSITPLGRTMLGLPVHPRLARMVAVDRSSLACVVATLVEERDIFRGRPDDLPADLALRVAVLSGRDRHDAADRGAVHRLRERAGDLARRARIPFDLDAVDPDRAGGVLLLGYPDRLAARRRPGQYQLALGRERVAARRRPARPRGVRRRRRSRRSS